MGNAPSLRLLDLDGSLPGQPMLAARLAEGSAVRLDLSGLGRALRLWSDGRSWSRLEQALAEAETATAGAAARFPLTLVGSGDYHHVSAALIARATGPLSVLHFDNHPDWCRCFPTRHCGGWVNMALAENHVHRVVTIGPCSDDLDRPDRKGANLAALSEGRHQVFAWRRPPTETRRGVADGPGHRYRNGAILWRNLDEEDFAAALAEILDALPTRRVWITIDKDVLAPDEAFTNWDQGRMPLAHLLAALPQIAARCEIVGADICGEYATLAHRHPMKFAEAVLDQPPRPTPQAVERGLQRNAATNRVLIGAFEALQ
ncbi:hypothetical protein GCM10011390_24270 [Aureimonas endophytica]|uniref:Arginase n=1 Tax=Aureimonas endophytica TaxID=2027858 RepID=A0A916ZMV3_9HYPH|nr:arginase [Aureimonas endophytica]GGE04477.1 hypothetical protein GCM10011390_24270 [Aureimonas endophytica]